MTRFSTAFIRTLLVAPLALAFSACTFPKSLGDSLTESDTDDSAGGSDSATVTSAGTSPEPLTSTSTDGTGVITTTTTGVVSETATSGNSDTDDSAASEVTGDSASEVTGDPTATTVDSATTDKPIPVPGVCWDEWHAEYWCECFEGSTQACGEDGISVCFAQGDFVVTHMKWGPCGTCAPGQQKACDIEGAPGRQFCNVDDVWIDDIDNMPTPDWGACILEADIACDPDPNVLCGDRNVSQTCDVDEQGVPHWTDC